MKSLIMPVAGRSSRFPGMRPKWLLTMPDGKLMFEKALERLPLADFERVVVVCLREHISEYLSEASVNKLIDGLGHPGAELCVLDEPTSSQSETVVIAIETCRILGPVLIKDCDNMFKMNWGGGNEVAVLNLNDVDLVDAKNKSYVEVDGLGCVTNIVEKQVISNYFCCGGYGFASAEEFVSHFSSIKSPSEVYISHVIYSMLMGGEIFKINHSENYFDWGTIREYRHYLKSFVTVFCDVDGVLLHNGSKFGAKGWRTEPIRANLEAIAKLQRSGGVYLIITSSRPDSEINYIERILLDFGVKANKFVMGLPHTRRVLINDYTASNPYPSAISINLERDSSALSSILDSVVG
jgi:hypothetical protein